MVKRFKEGQRRAALNQIDRTASVNLTEIKRERLSRLSFNKLGLNFRIEMKARSGKFSVDCL